MRTRVLVADDYEPWRREIRAALGDRRRWHIIGEAADGADTVQQTRASEPDLILLDVNLPVLDGIAAAREILVRRPHQTILFVSTHHHRTVVDAALTAGARGYLLKSDLRRELITAASAVLRGERFISTGVMRRAGLAHRAVEPPARADRHGAGFYSSDATLVDEYARLAAAAMASRHTVVLVTSTARRDRVYRALTARSVDVARAVRDGRCVWHDVEHVVASVTTDGGGDDGQLRHSMRTLLTSARAASCGGPVSFFGDGASALWARGYADAAVRIEHIWDEIATPPHVHSLCGYVLRLPCPQEQRHLALTLCGAHASVYAR